MPEVLVRRLFFVLTGLPPTPAAIEHWSAEIEGDAHDWVESSRD